MHTAESEGVVDRNVAADRHKALAKDKVQRNAAEREQAVYVVVVLGRSAGVH